MRGLGTGIGALFLLLAAAGCDGSTAIDETSTALKPATAIAIGQDQPGSLVVDDSYVYFAVYGDAVGHGSIRRVPKLGGPVTVLASGESGPGFLVADASRIYWTTNDYSVPNSGAVRSIAKTGGRATTLASGLSSARGLTADASKLYFAVDDYIVALSKLGGVPVPLTSARCVNAAASDSTTIYWTENCVLFPPQGVFAVSKFGGAAVKLSNDAPGNLLADGSAIYWVETGVVKAQSRFGGLPRVLYDTHSYGVVEAQDASNLYVQVDQTLVRVSKSGLGASVIWSGEFGPNAAATDASAIYFDGGYPLGAVYRLPR
jgi:hypothetical protein